MITFVKKNGGSGKKKTKKGEEGLVKDHTFFCSLFGAPFPNPLTKQARKLQATLEGCNLKLRLTYSLTDRGRV